MTGVVLGVAAMLLAGCSLVDSPSATPTDQAPLAPAGSVGYVVCPNEVTPVELDTDTTEAPISLPVSGSPIPGDFAIATSPDGQWAYVVTSDGSPSAKGSGEGTHNVVIPIDLATQQAELPIPIPGQGGTRAIVVLPGGGTVLAASGDSIVPIAAATRKVGTPLDLGTGHSVLGMALDPLSTMLYALVAGGVIPVDTANATAGALIPTGLSVSSVYSPHGIVVSNDGATVYVVGQGGTDFEGQVLPIDVATDAAQTATGFAKFGISDPAAIALTPDGSTLLVADSGSDWVSQIAVADSANPSAPIRLPQRAAGSGSEHPTDIVAGPGGTGAFVVDGFDSVIPYDPTSEAFGPPMAVCSGASSMAVAAAP